MWVLATACSSSESTPAPAPAPSTTSTPEDAGGTGDDACFAESTKLDCGNCCAQVHAKGFDVFAAALVACDCEGIDGGAGDCATECATSLCSPNGQGSDATCSTCVQKSIGAGGACQKYVVDRCAAEPDCLAQQKCAGGCQKLMK